jgi:DNA-binding transcriptional regulator YdaS (Cro superfamily)
MIRLMNLTEYLKQEGRQADLAAALSKSPAQIWQWKEGIRPVPTDLCAAIEKATAGQVTRQELRPEDYWLIWPDLPAPKTHKFKNDETSAVDVGAE